MLLNGNAHEITSGLVAVGMCYLLQPGSFLLEVVDGIAK